MTNSKSLQKVMEEISSIRLRGTALGWSAQQTFEAYKDLLPPEVTLINFPSKNLNCAGYALDLNHTTGDQAMHLERDFEQVGSSKNAKIYVMYFHEDWIHAGKIVDDRIAVSKWGWFEPVFKHPTLFYPGSWDKIRYFRRKGM